MSSFTLDTCKVDGIIERADNAMVTEKGDRSAACKVAEGSLVPLRQAILDVVERGVDKNACVIPSPRLDPYRLMDKAVLREIFVGDSNCCS
jgi:hypothetical protein